MSRKNLRDKRRAFYGMIDKVCEADGVVPAVVVLVKVGKASETLAVTTLTDCHFSDPAELSEFLLSEALQCVKVSNDRGGMQLVRPDDDIPAPRELHVTMPCTTPSPEHVIRCPGGLVGIMEGPGINYQAPLCARCQHGLILAFESYGALGEVVEDAHIYGCCLKCNVAWPMFRPMPPAPSRAPWEQNGLYNGEGI